MARENVGVPLEAELRQFVQRMAELEGRSMGGQIRFYILEARRRWSSQSAPAAATWPPPRTPPATLDEATTKLVELTEERAQLMKRDGPPGPASRHLSLQEQERLRWLHDEVATLKGEVRRFEQQERVA